MLFSQAADELELFIPYAYVEVYNILLYPSNPIGRPDPEDNSISDESQRNWPEMSRIRGAVCIVSDNETVSGWNSMASHCEMEGRVVV